MENEECKKTFDQIGLERVYLNSDARLPVVKPKLNYYQLGKRAGL